MLSSDLCVTLSLLPVIVLGLTSLPLTEWTLLHVTHDSNDDDDDTYMIDACFW